MKNRLFSLCLLAVLAVSAMTGCQTRAAERKMESAGRAMEHRAESLGEDLMQAVEPSAGTGATHASEPAISLDEAQNIALEHAGFTADQVTALHAEYEIEHGVPQYDVEFRHGTWEYDYEIHADTGEIMSYSKDD